MNAEDQIKIAIANIVRLRDELKDYKKEKKNMEKEIPEDLKQLIGAKKNLSDQLKEKENAFFSELREEKDYKQMTKDIVLTQEKIAEEKEKLFQCINGLKKNIPLSMDINVDNRLIRLQTEPSTKVYLNGKEEK